METAEKTKRMSNNVEVSCDTFLCPFPIQFEENVPKVMQHFT